MRIRLLEGNLGLSHKENCQKHEGEREKGHSSKYLRPVSIPNRCRQQKMCDQADTGEKMHNATCRAALFLRYSIGKKREACGFGGNEREVHNARNQCDYGVAVNKGHAQETKTHNQHSRKHIGFAPTEP